MKKFFSAVFSILFLASLFLSLALITLNNTLLSSSFHKQNLTKANFYQTVATDIAPQLLAQNKQSPLKQLPLSKKSLGTIIQNSLPQGWLQNQVEQTLDGIFAYLKGEKKTLAIVVDLNPVKGSIGPNLAENLQKELDKLPVCRPDQIRAMQSGQVESLNCLPSQVGQNNITRQLNRQMAGISQEIPGSIDLSKQLPTEAREQLQEIQKAYNIFKTVRIALIVSTMVLFSTLLLINKANILNFLKGLSITLLIFAGINLIWQSLVRSNISRIISYLPDNNQPILNILQKDLIPTTINSFLSFTTNINAVILAVTGVYLIFFFIKNKKSSNSVNRATGE